MVPDSTQETNTLDMIIGEKLSRTSGDPLGKEALKTKMQTRANQGLNSSQDSMESILELFAFQLCLSY